MPGAPSAGSTHAIVFDGFGAGEYGSQGSWLVGWILHRQTLYYRGAFTGLNVLRYVDGSLGPRPEAAEVTPTGLPGGGVVYAFGHWASAAGVRLWAIVATDGLNGTVYHWPAGAAPGAVTAMAGTIPVSTSSIQFYPLSWVASGGGKIYVAVMESGIYRIDFYANTITLLTGSPLGGIICQYGTRLVGTGQPSSGLAGQLVYSASDPTVWSGAAADGTLAGIISVGNQDPIVALIPERQGLLIAKSADRASLGSSNSGSLGMDQWYLLTGVPGVNSVVRATALSGAPFTQHQQAVLGDGTTMLVAGPRDGSVAIPGHFNGSVGQSMRHLSWISPPASGYAPTGAVLRLREPHDWLIVPKATSVTGPAGSAVGLLSRDQLITRLTLGTSPRDNQYAACIPQEDALFVTDAGPPPRFWQWAAYADAPGVGVSGVQLVPPAAQCNFTLPEWFNRSGGDVAVASVLVDFAYWDYPGAANGTLGLPATFDITLQTLRAKNSPDSPPQTMHFVQRPGAPGKSLGLNQRLRQVFNFRHVWGNGFQLSFSNLQMVSIQKAIPVLLDRAVQI